MGHLNPLSYGLLVAAAGLYAQTIVTLDSTAGPNSQSTGYSTNGGLTISQGFFVDYLLVGGGGSGGFGKSNGTGGGGGGGGGGVLASRINIAAEAHTITIGAGGVASGGVGSNGGNTSAFGITALGGGAGAGESLAGGSGGSGGGAGGNGGAKGSGTAGQGLAGGNAASANAGGGGGAGVAGSAATSTAGGKGGNGILSSINATATYYGAGGGGGVSSTGTAGAGGTDGGGAGGSGTNRNGGAGIANTGGGGGGSAGNSAGSAGTPGAGGSGIAIIRYTGSALLTAGGSTSSFTGNGTNGTNGTLYRVHTFKSSGTFNLSGLDFNTRLVTTLTNNISGTGNFTYNGPGKLVLAANSTYAGTTTITGGILQVGNASTAGTLGAGAVTNNATLLLNRSNALTLSQAISGTGTLIHQGTGTTTVTAANTFTGDLDIKAGIVELGTGGSFASTATLRLVTGATFRLAGKTQSFGSVIATAGTIDLGTNGTLGLGESTNLGATITGSGTVNKTGEGTLTLSGLANFTGTLSVQAGTLATSSADRMKSTAVANIAEGATLRLGGMDTLGGLTGSGTFDLGANNVSINPSASTSTNFAGALVGSGTLYKPGSGTFTLSGANSLFTGGVVVSGGTMTLDNDLALGTSNDVTVQTNATLSIAEGRTLVVKSLTLNTGKLTGLGIIRAASAAVTTGTLSVAIHDADGVSTGLVKTTASTATVTAASNFTGEVDIQGGVIDLSTGGSFSSAASLRLASGTTFRLSGGQTQTFAALNAAGGTLNLGTGTVLAIAGAGSFGGATSGTGSFAKTGTGELVLTGANTHSGATTVSGGRLSVNGSLGSPTVTVQSGGTLAGTGSLAGTVTVQSGGRLGGTSTIAGAVTVQSGGILAPGNSPGILATGNLTVAGLMDIEMAGTARGAAGYDSTSVTGTVTLSPTSTLSVTFLDDFVPEEGSIFFLIVNNNSDAVTGTFKGLDQDEVFSLGGRHWQISYVANYTGEDADLGVSLGTFTGGNDVAIVAVAVPEPSTYALGLGALLLAWAARRRRR